MEIKTLNTRDILNTTPVNVVCDVAKFITKDGFCPFHTDEKGSPVRCDGYCRVKQINRSAFVESVSKQCLAHGMTGTVVAIKKEDLQRLLNDNKVAIYTDLGIVIALDEDEPSEMQRTFAEEQSTLVITETTSEEVEAQG